MVGIEDQQIIIVAVGCRLLREMLLQVRGERGGALSRESATA